MRKVDGRQQRNGDRTDVVLRELHTSERRLRTVIEQSPLAIHVFAPDGTSLLANAAWDELWELTPKESSEEKNVFEDEQVRASGLLSYVREALDGVPVTTPPLLYDPSRVGRTGAPRWLRAFAYPVSRGGEEDTGREPANGARLTGSVSEVTLIIEDISERKDLQDRLAFRAFHDDLTGLANRALLMDRLGHALERTKRDGADSGGGERKVALLFMDLDNFKYVNDTLGHEAGDQLLAEVARRLRVCTRPQDTVARLGGDEFVVLLEYVARENEAGEAAGRIADMLRLPLRLKDHEVFVTASVGIVLAGPEVAGRDVADATEATPAEILRAADVAMYRSKQAGKDRHMFFDSSMDGHSGERLTLEGGLRRALERKEGKFVVHYQPVVGIASGVTLGYEALVRWEHPDRGLLPPSKFIPLAEETGLIIEIGHQVLTEACAQAVRLQEGLSEAPEPEVDPPTVWVNISARQLREFGFLELIENLLETSGLRHRPGSLGLEITESVAMDGLGPGVERTASALRRLREFGVRIAIDDFGTGYSSLSYLKRLPVDVIKIDRSFISGLGDDSGDGAIVSAVVTLARDMGLRTVGEGVETEEQLSRLQDRGCDAAQGFLFAMALPAASLPRPTNPSSGGGTKRP